MTIKVPCVDFEPSTLSAKESLTNAFHKILDRGDLPLEKKLGNLHTFGDARMIHSNDESVINNLITHYAELVRCRKIIRGNFMYTD